MQRTDFSLESPLELPEGKATAQHLDFRLQSSTTVRKHVSVVLSTKVLVICYRTCKELLQEQRIALSMPQEYDYLYRISSYVYTVFNQHLFH